MKKLLLHLIFLFIITSIQSQTVIYGVEYDSPSSSYNFVSVDPNTGLVSTINPLIGLQSVSNAVTTYNQDSSFYHIQDNEGVWTIDINTGSVIVTPSPVITNSTISDLHYDKYSGVYYAIEFEDTTTSYSSPLGFPIPFSKGISYFISIIPSTGAITRISTLPEINISIGCSSYDDLNKTFTFVTNQDTIYSIDVNLATIISSPALSKSIKELKFDGSTGTYYALEYDFILDINYLVTVDPSNGTVSQIGSIAGLSGPIFTTTSTIDTINGLYSIVDNNSNILLIDLSSANVSSSVSLSSSVSNLIINVTTFPNTNAPSNLQKIAPKSRTPILNIEGEQNNVTNRVMPEGNTDSVLNEINAYPNPTNSQLTISVNKFPTTLNIFSQNGKLIGNRTITSSKTKIDVSEYENGLYFFNLSNSSETVTKKIMVH